MINLEKIGVRLWPILQKAKKLVKVCVFLLKTPGLFYQTDTCFFWVDFL